MNKQLLLKILSLLGLGSIETGLGLGMEANNSDPWQIAVTAASLAIAWIIGHSSGAYYFKVKAFIHEVNDMLADDKITVPEIRDVFAAWKTGQFQPDLPASKRKK